MYGETTSYGLPSYELKSLRPLNLYLLCFF